LIATGYDGVVSIVFFFLLDFFILVYLTGSAIRSFVNEQNLCTVLIDFALPVNIAAMIFGMTNALTNKLTIVENNLV